MLRFILIYCVRCVNVACFRTLYVEFYRLIKWLLILYHICFRTLYVEVYRSKRQALRLLDRCFRTLYVEVYRKPAGAAYEWNWVSVHYMLRFIMKECMPSENITTVSVHYMLRFIVGNRRKYKRHLFMFPYIICWGLSMWDNKIAFSIKEFPYIICWGLSVYSNEW